MIRSVSLYAWYRWRPLAAWCELECTSTYFVHRQRCGDHSRILKFTCGRNKKKKRQKRLNEMLSLRQLETGVNTMFDGPIMTCSDVSRTSRRSWLGRHHGSFQIMGAHQVFCAFVIAASGCDARSEVNCVSARVPKVRNARGFVLSELPNTCSRTMFPTKHELLNTPS